MNDINNIESLKPKSKKGGARPGAGHPKGVKTNRVIEREAALRLFRDRVAKHTDSLLNAQLSLAKGTQMLFVIHTDSKGKRGKPEMITDVETITRFLDENEGNDGTLDMHYAEGSKAEDYFFMTTAAPSNQALESLLNRTYGKPQESVDITSGGEKLEGVITGYVIPSSQSKPTQDL
jgi:hypothetical protein